MRFIAKLTKENKELEKNIFSLKVQAALEDFYLDKNKKKKVKTFRYKNYQVKKQEIYKMDEKNLKKG